MDQIQFQQLKVVMQVRSLIFSKENSNLIEDRNY